MRIRWTTPAADDLTHICDYIEEHDGAIAARRVALAIVEGIGSLIRFPNRGRLGRKIGTRELLIRDLPWIASVSATRLLRSPVFCMALRNGRDLRLKHIECAA